MVLNEWAGVFPVTESNSETKKCQNFQHSIRNGVTLPVVTWATPEVKDDAEDDEAHDGNDFDGAVM